MSTFISLYIIVTVFHLKLRKRSSIEQKIVHGQRAVWISFILTAFKSLFFLLVFMMGAKFELLKTQVFFKQTGYYTRPFCSNGKTLSFEFILIFLCQYKPYSEQPF